MADTAAPAAKTTAAKKSTTTKKAPAPKKEKKSRKKDGTVADFKGDVNAFNNRPDDTESVRVAGQNVDSPVATFRSATGHNDDPNVGGVNS